MSELYCVKCKYKIEKEVNWVAYGIDITKAKPYCNKCAGIEG